MKKVVVTGISGQDGSYMADYLLENTDHEVFGMIRHSSNPNKKNYQHLLNNPRFKIISGDLTDFISISNVVKDINPDYFINFGAQSFVYESWNTPLSTFEIDAMGPLHCLEAIRLYAPKCRFYSAGSSEEVGDVDYCPQDLKHPLKPRSPYGAAKCAAKMITKVYRESYNLYAIHGRLYNHESERRGEAFVTRKITQGVARIYHAIKNNKSFDPIELGDIDAKRDWSHAYDFVDGIWRMLNQENYRKDLLEIKKDLYTLPDNLGWNGESREIIELEKKTEQLWPEVLPTAIKEYVLSSDETHSVQEFLTLAFKASGIEGTWSGGIIQGDPIFYRYYSHSKGLLMRTNPTFYRPAEVSVLLGDSKITRQELGWQPKISFNQLVERMVKHDIENYEFQR